MTAIYFAQVPANPSAVNGREGGKDHTDVTYCNDDGAGRRLAYCDVDSKKNCSVLLIMCQLVIKMLDGCDDVEMMSRSSLR